MARRDEILQSFLQNEMLSEKYELKKSEIPLTVREGLKSDSPIVKAISLIVDGLEAPTPLTDAALRNQILLFLNEAI